MQTSLREKVAVALGEPLTVPRAYTTGLGSKTKTKWVEVPKEQKDLPDPEDIAVVWRLRELAIEKDSFEFLRALYCTIGGESMALATASLAQIRTAALSVLHGVPVSTVRGWV